jgi:predicted DNA-binding transcriptional regulator AlpA
MKPLQDKLDGRSRTSIYEDVERGDLPQPIKLGGTLYWIEDEVDERLASLRENAA